VSGSRRWLALFGALLLTGCQSLGNSLYGQYFTLMKQAFSAGVGTSRVTRAQAAAIPYASLGYQLGDGPQQILVLATDTNGEQLWTAATHVVLMTSAGRVLRTQGLGHNLGATIASTGQNLPSPAAASSGPLSYRRLVDITDMGLYGVPLACRMSAQRRETIIILGSAIQTIRINESCQASGLDWSFTDTYWVALQGGLVWRSIQHVHPKLAELRIELFRPPGP
jgi:hypothetical protein